MSANAANRETGRDALTALLSAALVGVGLPAQAVYGYQKSDFEGQSPVVVVLSAGTRRQRFGMGTEKYRSWFGYEILNFVADADAAAGWTDADVEDRLDLLEKEIADVIADNRVTANWDDLKHDEGASQIVPALVGGKPYKLEILRVWAEKHD